MSKITSPDLMKLNNKKMILEIIYSQRNIYRAQIAEMTSMSNQTITNLVKELINEGLVKEVTLEKKSKGRNPMALSIDEKNNYVIGIEISVKGVEIGLFNVGLDLIQACFIPRSLATIDALKESLDKLLKTSKEKTILGISISTEGIIDERSGVVIKANDTGFNNVNLIEELSHIDIPVLVRNDVNMLAETYAVKEKNTNFMLVKLDRGIGAALVLNGKVHASDNNAAGEFGHAGIYTLKNPKACRCGKMGCLTTETSMTALESRLNLTTDEMKYLVQKGSDNMVALSKEIAEYIAEPLSNIITVLDLNSVILTGSVVHVFEPLLIADLKIALSSKISSWSAYQNIELLEDYEMVHKSAKLAVQSYFKGNEE